MYVPEDGELCRRLVRARHDTPVSGHGGHWKTWELMGQNYWWPGMGRYMDRYVASCDACNRAKSFPTAKAGLLLPNEVPQRKWRIVSVDFILELLQSHRFNSIMVAL